MTVACTFSRRLEDVATVLLLPAFFALTGMRTRIDLVSGWRRVARVRRDRPGGDRRQALRHLGGSPIQRHFPGATRQRWPL
jgi:hypothetical protein